MSNRVRVAATNRTRRSRQPKICLYAVHYLGWCLKDYIFNKFFLVSEPQNGSKSLTEIQRCSHKAQSKRDSTPPPISFLFPIPRPFLNSVLELKTHKHFGVQS